MKDKISIICPLYKGQKYVKNVIEMVHNNRMTIHNSYDVELIFVNDYPKESIQLDENYKWIVVLENEENVGIHQSRVNGLKVAGGNYILFLDQDDEIDEDYLKEQVERIGDCDAIVCNGIWRNNKKIYADIEEQKRLIKNVFVFPYIVSPGQVLLKRSAIPMEWLENILQNNGCDDALLWNLMLVKDRMFECNEEVLYIHVEEGGNASENYIKMYHSLKESFFYLLKTGYYKGDKEAELERIGKRKLLQYESYIELSNLFRVATKRKESIISYMKQSGMNVVVIYGYGFFGQRLEKLFEGSSIRIIGAIDREKTKYEGCALPIYTLEDELPESDLIVITPMIDYEMIRTKLINKTNGRKTKIISINALLTEME